MENAAINLKVRLYDKITARPQPDRRAGPQLSRLLSRLDKAWVFRDAEELASLVRWGTNKHAPMHRWFRYREAYSPELIDQLGLGRRILDPFSGCGSIMVGSATRSRTSVGIDLNPVASFAAKVKLSPLDERQLKIAADFGMRVGRLSGSSALWPVPELGIATKVFEPKILESLLRIRAAISTFTSDERVGDFLLLAWISILEEVGSYFKEGNGIKYRNKKRSAGQYQNRLEGEWQLARFGEDQRAFVLKSFDGQLRRMIEDANCWRRGNWSAQTAVQGSALELRDLVGRRRFDSVIFSPPYANRFDYFESFKVELWFGGFSNSYEELGKLRKSSMRSHLGADMGRHADPLDPLEDMISLMDREASSWRMGVPDLLRGYFHDLKQVLTQSRQVAPSGKCYVVIGNSAFAGVVIPTDTLTATLGMQVGYKRATILRTRHLTVAPQQRRRLLGLEEYMRESIVVLE